jgi:type VII secretion-associated serine protease mycosin
MAVGRVPLVLVTVILAASAVPVAAGSTPAHAAPTCTNQVAPSEPVGDLPWPQKRYAAEGLDALTTGAGVTVAVVDSGVDATHPQLKGQVLRGNDHLDRGGDGRLDCVGHGTAVASIIAAKPGDGVAFRGLAPGAKILPVRISEQQIIEGRESGRTVSAAQFAAGIRGAVDDGADVINLSVVLYQDHPAVRAAIAHAVASDVVVVAAVGNLHENGDPRPFPAAYDGVLGVGAIGQDGIKQDFSQVGSYVDLVAPGGEVLAAVPRRGHQTQSGTSYAVPFVAATAALLRAYRPDLKAADVIARIVATADPAPADAGSTEYGAGVVNPYRAVTETVAPARPVPSPAALPADPNDAATVARLERRAAAEERAVLFAAAGGAVAVVVLLVALVLPRGGRRRWRSAG